MHIPSWRRLGAYGAVSLLLMILVGVAANAEPFEAGEARAPGQRAVLPIERELRDTIEQTPTVADPIELPDWVAVTIAVVLGIALLYLLSRQRFSFRFARPSLQLSTSPAVITDEEEAEEIAEIARDLIEELNEGDNPRFAIQRAYAAVETGFGAQELARKPAETPLRYLDRIFGRHGGVKEPLAQLTELFQRARFSDEPVDESMRAGAIAALSDIRDYYTAIAWKKISSSRSKSKSKSKAAS